MKIIFFIIIFNLSLYLITCSYVKKAVMSVSETIDQEVEKAINNPDGFELRNNHYICTKIEYE